MSIKVPEISIVIVGFKSKQYLDSCLTSIKRQSIYNPHTVEVLYIDNGSFDGSVPIIQRLYPWVSTVRNMKNIGYPAALNIGVHYSSGDYILVMNADVVLEKNYLENALKKMKQDNHIAAIACKIYQYDFTASAKTSVFETVGIHAMCDREMLSARGANDFGQLDKQEDIYSVRDICAFYRKSSLLDVKIGDEYFDEDFFLYWEDLDLCWRLHLFGWRVIYSPSLVSYHAAETKNVPLILKIKERERDYFKRNERLMIIKNEFCRNCIGDFFNVFKRLLRPKGFMEFMRLLPSMLKKRWYIMRHKRASAAEMKKWFISSKSKKYLTYKAKHLETYAQFPPTN
ncbi:glycosyltransferase family 2 protein [Candidatus Peregrinibacteria bacterium]|nr:glycosyltransferase family 2 protein [Candidatus Peregrinibacteria bacterium]